MKPTLAEMLSIVVDSSVLVRERCGTDLACQTTETFLALCATVEADHGVEIQCVNLNRARNPFVGWTAVAQVELSRIAIRVMGSYEELNLWRASCDAALFNLRYSGHDVI